jgi:hypothetical protein
VISWTITPGTIIRHKALTVVSTALSCMLIRAPREPR